MQGCGLDKFHATLKLILSSDLRNEEVKFIIKQGIFPEW